MSLSSWIGDAWLRGVCSRKGHELEIVEDSGVVRHRSGMLVRDVAFRCLRCYESWQFYREAFVAGSGALVYFFDRKWGDGQVTRQARADEADRDPITMLVKGRQSND